MTSEKGRLSLFVKELERLSIKTGVALIESSLTIGGEKDIIKIRYEGVLPTSKKLGKIEMSSVFWDLNDDDQKEMQELWSGATKKRREYILKESGYTDKKATTDDWDEFTHSMQKKIFNFICEER